MPFGALWVGVPAAFTGLFLHKPDAADVMRDNAAPGPGVLFVMDRAKSLLLQCNIKNGGTRLPLSQKGRSALKKVMLLMFAL
jgi:hypothetical protein